MLFGDFMDIGADDRKYVEITDQAEVKLRQMIRSMKISSNKHLFKSVVRNPLL